MTNLITPFNVSLRPLTQFINRILLRAVDMALTPESGHGLSGELDLRGL